MMGWSDPRAKGMRVHVGMLLYQAQHELETVFDLLRPLLGKRADLLLDAAPVDRFDLSHVDNALAREVSFALVQHHVSRQFAKLERRGDRQHNDRADLAVIQNITLNHKPRPHA